MSFEHSSFWSVVAQRLIRRTATPNHALQRTAPHVTAWEKHWGQILTYDICEIWSWRTLSTRLETSLLLKPLRQASNSLGHRRG